MEPTIGSTETDTSHTIKSLADFNVFNWKPDPSISFDENIMDLVMLLTRNSICTQGHMACILVDPSRVRVVSSSSSAAAAAIADDDDSVENLLRRIDESIISAEINRSLFKPRNSDIHAEIGALGNATRRGMKTEGCTAFITMPPCKACFGALFASGIKRIVTRIKCLPPVSDAAQSQGIELTLLSDEGSRTARINTAIYGHPEGRKRTISTQQPKEFKRMKEEGVVTENSVDEACREME